MYFFLSFSFFFLPTYLPSSLCPSSTSCPPATAWFTPSGEASHLGPQPSVSCLPLVLVPHCVCSMCVYAHVWIADTSAVWLCFRASQLVSDRGRMGRGEWVCIHWPSSSKKNQDALICRHKNIFSTVCKCTLIELIAHRWNSLVSSWQQSLLWEHQCIHQHGTWEIFSIVDWKNENPSRTLNACTLHRGIDKNKKKQYNKQ